MSAGPFVDDDEWRVLEVSLKTLAFLVPVSYKRAPQKIRVSPIVGVKFASVELAIKSQPLGIESAWSPF